jgi:hypothetical protein
VKVDTSRDVATNIHGAVNFKLSQDAHKLFSMLSDYLYADKEFCVLYELSTNADDEHKQSGVTQPFDVILPTRLSNKLVIRDYGRGLPEHLIYDLLGTYGASGKAQDANAIGGWGIGFKSVAAVSTTWNIISRNNGVETHYLVFVTGNGIPAITKTIDKPTTESGLEIQIPIETGREHIWQGLITKVYRHFPTKPNVVNYGAGTVKWPEDKAGLSGDGWALRESGDYSYGNASLITSHREYTVNKAKIRESLDQKYMFMLEMPFVFSFDIGTLDLSISRESVQYTPKSIKAINDRFIAVHDEVVTRIATALSAATDELNYRELIFSTATKIFGNRGSMNSSSAIVNFMKKAVNGKYGIVNLPEDAQSVMIPIVGKVWAYNGNTLSEVKAGFNCWKSHIASTHRDPADSKKLILKVKIDKLTRCEFYLKDVYDSSSRIRSNHDGSSKFMFLFENDSMPPIMKKRLLKAGKLTKAPRAVSTTTKQQGDIYKIWKATFTKTTYDPKSKSCYIVADNVRDHWWMTDNLRAKINHMTSQGYVILAVKKNVSPPAGCREITAEMEFKMAEIEKNPDLAKEQLAYKWERLATYSEYSLRTFLVMLSKIQTKGPSAWNALRASIGDLMDYARDNGSRYTPWTEQYNQIASVLGKPELKYNPLAFNSKDAYNDIKLKYPLLKYAGDSWLEADVKQYIEQCGV